MLSQGRYNFINSVTTTHIKITFDGNKLRIKNKCRVVFHGLDSFISARFILLSQNNSKNDVSPHCFKIKLELPKFNETVKINMQKMKLVDIRNLIEMQVTL